MDKDFLNQHVIIVQMILILFEGSIRYEDLSEIITKTRYNNIKSPSSVSRFFSKFRKGGIFNELTDKDGKKRFRINKPVIAYLKKVESQKVSSVSVKADTLVRSNFKVRYFIEKFMDQNPKKLPLEKIVVNACNQEGNLFNPRDEEAIERIIQKIGSILLTENTITSLKKEEMVMKQQKETQLKNLKLGSEKRKELALLKEQGVDVGEEHKGEAKQGEVKSKKNKKKPKYKNSLNRLKNNNVFLNEILIEDVSIPDNYKFHCSIYGKDVYVHFQNLNTKKITLKYVHFCSSVDTKTSRIIELYEMTKDYSNGLKTINVIEDAIRYIRETQEALVRSMPKAQFYNVMKNLKFKADHVVQIEVEFDVIFLNEINYKRVIKNLKSHKKLMSELAKPNYDPRTTYKINFRHYNIYPMNEQTKTE